MAGESYIVRYAKPNADDSVEPGKFFQNLFIADLINYPAKDDFSILDVVKVNLNNNTYILQRLTIFKGILYVRAKIGTEPWSAWKRVI